MRWPFDTFLNNEACRVVVETAHEGIMVADLAGTIVFANPMMATILGLDRPDRIAGHSVFETRVGEDADWPREKLTQRWAGQSDHYEGRIRRVDGSTVWVSIAASPLRDNRGRVVATLAVIRDITPLRRAEEQRYFRAYRDPLTGLSNRADLTKVLARLLEDERQTGLALLLIDIHGFSEINCCLGHDLGDLALLKFSRQLSESASRADLIARLDGDQFAIVAGGIRDPGFAVAFAELMILLLRRTLMVGGLEISIGVKVGVVQAPAHGNDTTSLLRRANIALHSAKQGTSAVALYEPNQAAVVLLVL